MRRLSAQYIFPVNSPPLKNGIVEVDDTGTILNVIDTHGQNREQAGIEFFNGILVPGFVNTHCHLELSFLKGKITPQKGLASFIKELKEVSTGISSGIIAAKADFFDKLMWQNGIVAVGDISNDTVTFPIKKESKIYYHSFLEFFGLISQKAKTVYSSTKKKVNTLTLFNLKGNPVPHAPYSISPELFNLFLNDRLNPETILSVHFQETADENSFFKNRSGNLFDLFKEWQIPYPFKTSYPSSTDYLLSNLPENLITIFVHNTFIAADDLLKIKEKIKNPFFCLCPNANLYIENRLPDVSLLQKFGVPITLGTDSLASNNSLSILNEMKTLQHYFPTISLEEMITWATLNGAKALRIDEKYGSIVKGKKSGINLVENLDLQGLQLLPETIVRKLV